MGIALTDDHRELAEVARGFLTSQKARAAARSLLDAPEEERPPFWQGIVELGWLGLHIDEEHGGSGYGLPELVVVIDELGRAVAPGPFVPTVIASAVIAKDGSAEQKSRLLPGLIDGTVTAGIGLGGQVQLGDGVADGEAGIVLGAGLADLLLIAAGDDVLVLERGRSGVSVEVPENLDPTRRSGRVRLEKVSVSDDDILRGSAGIGAGPRPDTAGRRGGRRGRRLRRRRRRLRQGAAAVRPHHRHLPGGQASLREHVGGRRVGDRRGVGRLAGGVRGRGAVPAGGGFGCGTGVSGLCAQRGTEHSGARRYRLHLGARRASAPAPGAGDDGTVRRRRTRRRCVRPHRRRCRPGEQPGPAARGRGDARPESTPTPPRSPHWTRRRSATS